MQQAELMSRGEVTLYLTSAEGYIKANVTILKKLVNEQKIPGIYITVNKPYLDLIHIFSKNDIKFDHIFIIDAITKATGSEPPDAKNCIFLDGPTNLTDLTIALRQAVDLMKDKNKFIFFDALSTLLIYNPEKTVVKFAHFLTGRIREWDAQGILISIDKDMNETLKSQLIQFCDKKVDATWATTMMFYFSSLD